MPAAKLSSAHAQAASLTEVAAASEALRTELESELLDTQRQLADLTVRLTDSNMVSTAWQLSTTALGRAFGLCCFAQGVKREVGFCVDACGAHAVYRLCCPVPKDLLNRALCVVVLNIAGN